MANTLYDSARAAFAKGEIDWINDDIRVVLCDVGYVFSAAHASMADIALGDRVPASSTGVALTTQAVETNGAVNADDATFTSVTGDQVKSIVLYKYVDATPANCPLIAYLDSATGLPITPNGGDIIITWDNGTNKIFRL